MLGEPRIERQQPGRHAALLAFGKRQDQRGEPRPEQSCRLRGHAGAHQHAAQLGEVFGAQHLLEAAAVGEHHEARELRRLGEHLGEAAGREVVELQHEPARCCERRRHGRRQRVDAIVRQVHGAEQVGRRRACLLHAPEDRAGVLGGGCRRHHAGMRAGIGALKLIEKVPAGARRRLGLCPEWPASEQSQPEDEIADQAQTGPSWEKTWTPAACPTQRRAHDSGLTHMGGSA